MKRPALLILLLAVLCLVAWLVVGPLSEEPPRGASSRPAERAQETPPTLRSAGVAREGASGGDKVPGAVPTPEPTAKPKPKTVRIVGRVRRADDGALRQLEVYLLRKQVPGSDPRPEVEPIRIPTRPDGTFDVHIVVDDLTTHWLCARSSVTPGVLPAFLDGAEIDPGVPVVLVLAPGRVLEVEVVDGAGKPLLDSKVTLAPRDVGAIRTYPLPGEPTMGSIGVPTSRDGNLMTFTLPYAGPLRLTVRKRGFAKHTSKVEPDERRVRVVLLQPRTVIRVHLENAEEWPQAVAVLQPDDDAYGRFAPHLGQASFVNGVATFTNRVGPGEYRVRVWASDTTSLVLRGIRLTPTVSEASARGRLERRPGFGRLLIAWPRLSENSPLCWIRLPGEDWQRWFQIWTVEDGLELRNLSVGPVDVVLGWRDGVRVARVDGFSVQDRADGRVAPRIETLRSFVFPEALKAALDSKKPLKRAWVVSSDGRTMPLLLVRKAAPPIIAVLGRADALVHGVGLVRVPSDTAQLHWEYTDGSGGDLPLRLMAD